MISLKVWSKNFWFSQFQVCHLIDNWIMYIANELMYWLKSMSKVKNWKFHLIWMYFQFLIKFSSQSHLVDWCHCIDNLIVYILMCQSLMVDLKVKSWSQPKIDKIRSQSCWGEVSLFFGSFHAQYHWVTSKCSSQVYSSVSQVVDQKERTNGFKVSEWINWFLFVSKQVSSR